MSTIFEVRLDLRGAAERLRFQFARGRGAGKKRIAGQ